MYSVPADLLNAIADFTDLRTEWARRLFSLDAPGVLAALSAQAKALEARGVPNKVILAYQTFGPLLDANEAISEYIMMAECPSLRSCLTEVVSVDEAVLVADAEYRLADDEQAELARLLSAEPEPNA